MIQQNNYKIINCICNTKLQLNILFFMIQQNNYEITNRGKYVIQNYKDEKVT